MFHGIVSRLDRLQSTDEIWFAVPNSINEAQMAYEYDLRFQIY